MPGRKMRYNVRFPPGRIKKIMQKNTEVGRIAMAVPVMISRAMEMFLKSLLTKICLLTQVELSGSGVLSLAHMKKCIESEKLFHFLKELAERATSMAGQTDKRRMMSMWPLYSTSRRDISVKNTAEVVEMAPRKGLSSLDNDSSSGESELYICL